MAKKKQDYSSPVVAGILIMVFFIAFQLILPIKANPVRLVMGALSIILRIIAVLWISELTKQQGRKSLFFMLLGILLPAITLIVVGAMGDKKPIKRPNKRKKLTHNYK